MSATYKIVIALASLSHGLKGVTVCKYCRYIIDNLSGIYPFVPQLGNVLGLVHTAATAKLYDFASDCSTTSF